MSRLLPRFKLKRDPAEPSDRKRAPSLSLNTDVTNTQRRRPVVKSPDWEIRYDPTLSVYYYINVKTNEAQFDHPDEVVSPLASPMTRGSYVSTEYLAQDDHRKVFRTGTVLKRTLSPKFFGNATTSLKKRTSMDKPSSNHSSPKSFEDKEDEEDDEDVAEFKKQLDLEIQSYESERLQQL